MKPCSPAMERIPALDFSKEESSAIFDSIDTAPEWGKCAAAAVVQIADKLNAQSARTVLAQFCGAVATYAKFFSADDLARIRAAYVRFPVLHDDSRMYFLGLEATHLDLRAHLKGKLTANWSFPSIRRDDETWNHHRYLASLGEPGALEALAKKVATTKHGNDAYLFLLDLSESKIDGVEAVIRRYENDSRRTDTPNGPGIMISQWVQVWLKTRAGR